VAATRRFKGYDLTQPRQPPTKGSPERPVIPKAARAFRGNALPCRSRQLAASRLAGCRRVDRPLYTGLWTPAFGRWLSGHLVPSDTGRFRHWSLSALVGIGSGWCEKPTRSTGSFNSRSEKEFPPDQPIFLSRDRRGEPHPITSSARATWLIQATPLSEAPQSTTSRLIARRERSTK
jgi:hypothetical protein